MRWLPVARDYPGAEVLNWKDLSPRVGVVLRPVRNRQDRGQVLAGRYVLQEGKGNTNSVHPVIAATNSISRTWTDRNGDFIVQGDPLNPLLNDELGPSPNNNFGKPNTTLRFDPDWANGFGARPFNWECWSRCSTSWRRGSAWRSPTTAARYGNFIVNDNVLVSPADYDPYCINAPVDARLPGGGGQRICGLFDLKHAKVGPGRHAEDQLVDLRRSVRALERPGRDVQARLQSGVMLQGGFSGGKQMADNCDVVGKIDNPGTYLCHRESAFLPQVKLLGTYPLPWWGLQASGTFQSQISDPVGGANFDYNYFGLPANYVAGNAQISPSLGRNLSSGGTVTINVVEPGTLYPERTNQFDRPSAKTFAMGGGRGCRRCSTSTTCSTRTTSLQTQRRLRLQRRRLGTPQAIVPGRLVKFGAQLRFWDGWDR